MKYCPECGLRCGTERRFCPRDGAPLSQRQAFHPPEEDGLPPSETSDLDDLAANFDFATDELAAEIDALLFRVCKNCKRTFGPEVSVCPHDHTHLAEVSVHARDTMFFGGPVTGRSRSLRKYCQPCDTHFPLHCTTCSRCGRPLEIPTFGVVDRFDDESEPVRPGSERTKLTDKVIGGKYRLLKDIGAGGFGSVYLAKHESLGKRFAVKLLRPGLSARTEFRDRFHEEALKLSRLEDENIVKIVDFGESDDVQYMVTEYVEGIDLGDVIYSEKADVVRAATIMRQVASALAEAHAKQIVHLDLKPYNILLAQKRGRDVVKVIDFGIAELYSESVERRQKRVTGTATYMAPEQWQLGPLDPRTDVYAFGLIFYEFLAGEPPFRGNTIREFQVAHCETEAPLLRKLRPDVPADIERLVERCLEKNPARRYASAEDIERILERFLNEAVRRPERHVVRGIVAILLLLAFAASAFALREFRRDTTPPEWQDFSAIGDGVMVVESIGKRKEYSTRRPTVEARFLASDDRDVEEVRVTFPRGDRKVISGNSASYTIELDWGWNSISAVAVDRSGNESLPATVNIELLRPPSVEYEIDESLRYTKSESTELRVIDIDGAILAVECTANPGADDAEPHFRIEVSKSNEDYAFAGSGAESQLRPSDGDLGHVRIPLETGRNVIRVEALDESDRSVLKDAFEHEIHRLARPLEIEATVSPVADSILIRDGDTWVSSSRLVAVELSVPDADERLSPGAVVEYRLEGDPEVDHTRWDTDELRSGKLSFEVELRAEEPRALVIEPIRDKYGYESERRWLKLELDSSGPELRLHETLLRAYRESPPALTFECADRHRRAPQEQLRLLRLNSSEIIDSAGYEIAAGPAGALQLQFRDPGLLAEDGVHSFRIVASDDLGNESSGVDGEFTVIVDRTSPKIEVISPFELTTFERGDTLELEVRVQDEFPGDVSVRAEFQVETADGIRIEPFSVAPARHAGEWSGSIRIGTGGLEKPRAFASLRPRFVLRIVAEDGSGRRDDTTVAQEFGWENGDRLLHARSNSVLVYHGACRRYGVTPFFVGETEVTNEQFLEFVDAQGGSYDVSRPFWSTAARLALRRVTHPRSPDWEGGRPREDRRDFPIRGVSFYEARAYARWAGLEIPTRSHWTVAAFWNYDGTDPERPQPWLAEPTADTTLPVRGGDLDGPTHARASTGPYLAGRTPYGLFHLFGNVWEFGLDRERDCVVQMGGAFYTPETVFREPEHRKYLRGEPPDGPRIDRDETHDGLGFRCILIPADLER